MAKYLAFTGGHFPPSSPVLAGLISEIVDPEELETRQVFELASTLADKSPLGLRRMKLLINDAPDQSLAHALAAEQQALGEQCRSEDFAEGNRGVRCSAHPRLPGPIGEPAVPFTLSEDHLAFQQSVRTLARSRYADSMLARSQSERVPDRRVR